jgi:hypothetical protein
LTYAIGKDPATENLSDPYFYETEKGLGVNKKERVSCFTISSLLLTSEGVTKMIITT